MNFTLVFFLYQVMLVVIVGFIPVYIITKIVSKVAKDTKKTFRK